MAGRRRRTDRPSDPWTVLGLERGATAAEITAARKELSRSAHPDAGGSVDEMQRLNAAAEAALADVDAAVPASTAQRSRRRERPRTPGGGVRHDHPSFTIEALPAEAFEGLLVAGAALGEVVDDDPPYLLEMQLDDPVVAWCRLELVPDAGAATVSITTARIPGHPTPDVLEVRDRWIDALNRLDWAGMEQPPC
ncbi:hypothetical protein [Ilumatobacter sp.]|uniref:hypothetical protein n=1 Tax=Ilumatobacter sp. TaxID=1967498 RepID=UPI003AF6BD02